MKKILTLIITLSCLFSCKSIDKKHFMGTTQGTYYSIIYYDELNRDFSHDFDSIFNIVESTLSLWDENSVLRRVNRNDTSVVLNDIFIDNFNIARQAAEISQGAFDPTIAPLVSAWGFHYKKGTEITPDIIDSLKQLVDYRKIKIIDRKLIKENPAMTLDFNAVAQGYTSDIIADFLLSKNVNNFLIDVGGEIIAKGSKPNNEAWKVGIEKPAENKDDERIVQEIIELKDKSIVTSGNYRKYVEMDGKRFSHSIDPTTGYPAENNLLSVTIIADNTAWADCLASISMVVGMEKATEILKTQNDVEAFFIYIENNETKTQSFSSKSN